MIAHAFQSDLHSCHRCPVCNEPLPCHPALLSDNVPCLVCGAYLWCSKRVRDGLVLLEAIPGRTPEPVELNQVAQGLRRLSQTAHVVFDLSALDTVSSSFVARLIGLGRDIHSAGGRLVLSQLSPVVREELQIMRLDTLFELQ